MPTQIPPPSAIAFGLMEKLRRMPDAEYLLCLLAYHAAPTLQGIKPATLVCPGARGRNLGRALVECGSRLGAAFGVEVADFRNWTGDLLLLVYDPGLLRSALDSGDVAALLTESGYDLSTDGVAEALTTLRMKCADRRFPHEIGVFLGYPVGDVKHFMADGGKGCPAVTAWRAYADADEAYTRSASYRRAKQRAAELIMGGADLSGLAAGLRIGA